MGCCAVNQQKISIAYQPKPNRNEVVNILESSLTNPYNIKEAKTKNLKNENTFNKIKTENYLAGIMNNHKSSKLIPFDGEINLKSFNKTSVDISSIKLGSSISNGSFLQLKENKSNISNDLSKKEEAKLNLDNQKKIEQQIFKKINLLTNIGIGIKDEERTNFKNFMVKLDTIGGSGLESGIDQKNNSIKIYKDDITNKGTNSPNHVKSADKKYFISNMKSYFYNKDFQDNIPKGYINSKSGIRNNKTKTSNIILTKFTMDNNLDLRTKFNESKSKNSTINSNFSVNKFIKSTYKYQTEVIVKKTSSEKINSFNKTNYINPVILKILVKISETEKIENFNCKFNKKISIISLKLWVNILDFADKKSLFNIGKVNSYFLNACKFPELYIKFFKFIEISINPNYKYESFEIFNARRKLSEEDNLSTIKETEVKKNSLLFERINESSEFYKTNNSVNYKANFFSDFIPKYSNSNNIPHRNSNHYKNIEKKNSDLKSPIKKSPSFNEFLIQENKFENSYSYKERRISNFKTKHKIEIPGIEKNKIIRKLDNNIDKQHLTLELLRMKNLNLTIQSPVKKNKFKTHILSCKYSDQEYRKLSDQNISYSVKHIGINKTVGLKQQKLDMKSEISNRSIKNDIFSPAILSSSMKSPKTNNQFSISFVELDFDLNEIDS